MKKSAGLWVLVLAAGLMAGASYAGKWLQPDVKMADIYPRPSLASAFPQQFGTWRMEGAAQNMPLAPDVEKQIKTIYTETADRVYVNDRGERMMVTVAYGRDQSDGFKVHRPEVCYAAQGFVVKAPQPSEINLGTRQIGVQRVDTHKADRFEPVTYWMVIGDKVVNTPWRHKVEQVQFAFHGLIADGLLVRISSFSKDPAEAYSAQDEFVRQWMAHVPNDQRSRLFGS